MLAPLSSPIVPPVRWILPPPLRPSLILLLFALFCRFRSFNSFIRLVCNSFLLLLLLLLLFVFVYALHHFLDIKNCFVLFFVASLLCAVGVFRILRQKRHAINHIQAFRMAHSYIRTRTYIAGATHNLYILIIKSCVFSWKKTFFPDTYDIIRKAHILIPECEKLYMIFDTLYV